MDRIYARCAFLVLAATTQSCSVGAQNQAITSAEQKWQPPSRGIIPNANTAAKVGVAVLTALGPDMKREVEEFEPWHAELDANGNWEVRGTIPGYGGTAVVVVSKSDGRIVDVSQEQ